MPGIEISVEWLLGNLTPENAAALSGGPLDGGQVWYEFLTQEDDRVRPSHRALHGTVWTAGDPAAPMPPLDYGCRCFIRYVAAPGSAAAEILPPAPSEPTTQDAAFGSFLDAEAAGWRAAMAKANQGPAGDVLPDMATYFIGTGMSSSQAKDAARMAAAATQATRAIPATIALPPAATPLEPEKPAVATLPPASGAETVALEPLPPVLQRPAPARATVAPTADQAADQAAADAKAQAAWEAAQAAKQAAASAAAKAAYLADQAAQAAAAEAKAKAARAAAVAADKAKVEAAAQAKAAAAAAEDAAAEQAYQAKIAAAKAADAAVKAGVEAQAQAQAQAKAQAAKAAAAAAEDALDDAAIAAHQKKVAEAEAKFSADVAKAAAAIDAEALTKATNQAKHQAAIAAAIAAGKDPKKVLSPEQKAINNLKSKARRLAKKMEKMEKVDDPNPVGSIKPSTPHEEIASKVVYSDFQQTDAKRFSKIEYRGIQFGRDAGKLAGIRKASSMAAARDLMETAEYEDTALPRETERNAATHNTQISDVMHAGDPTTIDPVLRFTFGNDRYMRMIDQGATAAEVARDMVAGVSIGKGPLKSMKSNGASTQQIQKAAEDTVADLRGAVDKMNDMLSRSAYTRRVPVLYRGMHSLTDAQMKGIIDLDEFKFGAMSSSTTKAEIGRSFQTSGGGNRVLFRMQNARGMPIKARSRFNHEDEVMLHRDERFRIVSVMKQPASEGKADYIVDMEAIE